MQFGLVAAELVVETDAGDKELVVAAGRRREHVAADRSTGVRHADDAVAEAEVVALAVHTDPQPFELDGQVVGPGILDTGAENPAGVVAAAIAEECAIANRGSDHGRRGTDVEVGLEGGEGEPPGLCEGLDLLETRRREQGAESSRIAEGEVPRGCCRVLGRVPSDDGIDAGGEGALGRKAAGSWPPFVMPKKPLLLLPPSVKAIPPVA